jgi:hypothetical protein
LAGDVLGAEDCELLNVVSKLAVLGRVPSNGIFELGHGPFGLSILDIEL